MLKTNIYFNPYNCFIEDGAPKDAAPVEIIPQDKIDNAKNLSLSDTIKAAMESAKPKEEVKEKKVEVKKEDATKEDKKVEKKGETEEVSPEEIKAFKELKILLSDPKTAKETLTILANKSGVNLREVETKKEVKEAVKTITDELRDSLGDDFKFIADILGPGLEKVIKAEVSKGTESFKDYQRNQEVNKLQTEISDAVDSSFGKYENSNEFEADVHKLMDSFKRDGSISHADYFDNLLIIAAAKKGVLLIPKGTKDIKKVDEVKAKANAKDAASRLASERNAEVKTGVGVAKKMGLKESIEDAISQANTKFNA